MLYMTPDYYKDFVCIAGACEDTCCAGWQISIDDEAFEKYMELKGAEGEQIRRGIKKKDRIFRQDREKRCVFLTDNLLCHMYELLGEDALCDTCKMYPRHIEEFENVREYSLSMSCPQVAKMLAKRTRNVEFLYKEDDKKEYFEDYDPQMYSMLADVRKNMIKVSQDRGIPFNIRMSIILQRIYEIQEKTDNEEITDAYHLFDASCRPEDIEKAKHQIKIYEEQSIFENSARIINNLYELENIREDWFELLGYSEHILFSQGENAFIQYSKQFEEFEGACIHNLMNTKENTLYVIYEQLFVYFIYVYFCGAVYDGMIYDKVYTAVSLIYVFRLLFMSRYIMNDQKLCLEDISEIMYRFSRELEHSDNNLEIIEEIKWL